MDMADDDALERGDGQAPINEDAMQMLMEMIAE